jgi:hypothetical protein
MDCNPVCLQLAQAYIPPQIYINRWDPMKGLMMGTIFPELFRSYRGYPRDRRHL